MYSLIGVKTDYSLLSSLVSIDRLIEYLKKYNMTSCAIVDDNLFGVMEFFHKMKNNNIKPIIGLEVIVGNEKIYLYAKNYDGYLNLVRINNIKQQNIIDLDILKEYSSNLVCVSLDNDIKDKLKEIYSDFFIGCRDTTIEEEIINKGYEPIFFYEVLYLEKYEYKYLPYLFMIRDGKTISEGIEFNNLNNYILDDSDVVNFKVAKINTNKLEKMCDVVFPHNLYMPLYDVSDAKSYLINLSNKGLKKRLGGNVSKVYQDRLDYELKVIIDMQFCDYFLVVYDYIKYAKQNGILVGPGRGSAAGSLVSYSLGITDIDPVKYNLLFERFLNPERVTMPDIDTDFPDVDRDRVIDYVKSKYGKKKVAGIITFGSLGAKQATRDVGRVLNIDSSIIDEICKKLSFKDKLKDLKNRDRQISNLLDSDDKLKLLYHVVNLIEGNKRHSSIHAAGIVISRVDLDTILPIKYLDDEILTGYTMEYLEEIGLIKMDFLGIRNLSIIQNIISDLKSDGIKIDFNNIPMDDRNVFKMFSYGDTTGIFQFESEGMKSFLRQLKPKNFLDICSCIALFRPGPSINIPSFIRRRENKEKINYIHENLKDILYDTSGIIVYQEQIMQIANVMASYSLGEADILRRAMAKRKYDLLKNEEEKFINNSIKNGYSKELSKYVYDLILNFANYGFNKSHSVSYSVVSYKMAYLKYYYPKYFYSNLLVSVIGSEGKTLEYLKELKKLGVKILNPDVNLSYSKKYKVMENGVVMPLLTIRNIGDVLANSIVLERDKKSYQSIFDFLVRTYPKTSNKKVFESLVYSKALSGFGYNINTLINNMDSIINYVELSNGLEEGMVLSPDIKMYEEIDMDSILEHEKELFGFYLTSHKTEKYKLRYKNIVSLIDIDKYFDKKVNIIISVDKLRQTETKNNDLMAFIEGSDNTSSVSVIVFPKVYKEVFKTQIKKKDVLMVYGRVEKRYNEYQVIADKISNLSGGNYEESI